ncbi:hypothetical protein ES703_11145 [subsurface metagenome]
MTAVLVTGGTGTLGQELIHNLVARGQKVRILARDTKKAEELFSGLEILKGDVTEDNLGLVANPRVDAVYHLAGLLDLSEKHRDVLWNVNVVGTQNVIKLMKRYEIPHLYFCSTAYTQGKNCYEETKATAENWVRESGVKYSIFKPGIIVPNSMTFEINKPQHLYLAARLWARLHRRAEPIRKKIEGTLHLPPKQISCRIKGDPRATLNLVHVDWIAEKMASVQDEGVYMLTSQKPLRVSKLLDWLGEVLFLNLKVEPEFKMRPHEALFDRLAKPFLVYVQDDFSRFKHSFNDCPAISREFIQRTVINSILG